MKGMAFLFTVMFALGIGGTAHGLSVIGSKHDMTTWIANETTTQACVFCHTPHGGAAGAPLWNHTLSNATYSLYGSQSIQGQITQPNGISKACLSCHDGTVAINSLYVAPRDGNAGTSGTGGRSMYINATDDAGSYIGTDLSEKNPSHPMSIAYRPDLNSGLRANTGAAVVYGKVTIPLYGDSAPYSLECASCHNAHDPANPPFLRVGNLLDELCTTCHLK